MSSSRTAPASSQPIGSASALLTLLESVPDPRRARGIWHQLPGILAVGIAAVAAGAQCSQRSDSGPRTPTRISAALGSTGRCVPSESAIRRTFNRLDATVLDSILGAWLWTRTTVVGQRRVIALD